MSPPLRFPHFHIHIYTLTVPEARQAINENDENDVSKRIFDLLSCRRVVDAASLAEKMGMFRLASIIVQADGDIAITDLIRGQVQMWLYMGASDLVPTDLLNVYRLIGAEYTDDNGGSILKGKGWKRTLGMLFWYGCSNNFHYSGQNPDDGGKLLAALRNYQFLHHEGNGTLVDEPRKVLARAGEDKDGLFTLLEALLLGNEREDYVINALRPEGYTRDRLDYRASFIVLSMLECLERREGGRRMLDPAKSYGCIVRQHFVSQLVSEQEWVWAVFVAMHAPWAVQRKALVKSLLCSWVGAQGDSWDPEQQLGIKGSDCEVMVACLKVPFAWICEATAIRAAYTFQRERAANLMCLAVRRSAAVDGRLVAAAQAALDVVLPALYLRDQDAFAENGRVHTLFEALESGPPSVYREFFKHKIVKEAIDKEAFAKEEEGLDQAERVASLKTLRSQAQHILSKVDKELQQRAGQDPVPQVHLLHVMGAFLRRELASSQY